MTRFVVMVGGVEVGRHVTFGDALTDMRRRMAEVTTTPTTINKKGWEYRVGDVTYKIERKAI